MNINEKISIDDELFKISFDYKDDCLPLPEKIHTPEVMPPEDKKIALIFKQLQEVLTLIYDTKNKLFESRLDSNYLVESLCLRTLDSLCDYKDFLKEEMKRISG